MNINEILSRINLIVPYQKGTHEMWTDDYISTHLLNAHINTENNTASRKGKNIDKTVNWIISKYGKKDGEILDLGCGPGLYTQRFAERGYNVVGIDFSKRSIDYAKKMANKKSLNVEYKCMNYLDITYEEEFDIVMIVYLDFGALAIEEREIFIANAYKALKPGGIMIFDALNDKGLQEENASQSWEISKGGFWQKEPYIYLSRKLYNNDYKALLSQHLIIDEDGQYKTYHFWNHYFADGDVKSLFMRYGFTKVESYKNFVNDNTYHNNDVISFHVVTK